MCQLFVICSFECMYDISFHKEKIFSQKHSQNGSHICAALSLPPVVVTVSCLCCHHYCIIVGSCPV